MLFPDKIAAAVPMSGGAQGDVREVAAVIKDIPTWVFHGARDQAVPVANSRAIVQAMRNAGGMPRYTEYPSLGHVIWSVAYADGDGELYPWLFSQTLSESPPAQVPTLSGWGFAAFVLILLVAGSVVIVRQRISVYSSDGN